MIADIQTEVARHYGISASDLRGSRGGRRIETAKRLAYYMARTSTGKSYSLIGREFGGKDHTTILHGCQQMQRLVETSEADRRLVAKLSKKFPPVPAPEIPPSKASPQLSRRVDLWTRVEVETLRNMAEARKPIIDVMNALGRSERAIRSKASRLDISFNWHGNHSQRRGTADSEYREYASDAARGSAMLREAILRALGRPQEKASPLFFPTSGDARIAA